MIHPHQPQVGQKELAAVAEVFDSKWPGRGPRTEAFEAAFAAHLQVDAEHVVFLNSGTAGLLLAVESLDLAEGDEVVLPSPSFVAAANAVVAGGGRPVFCDVDPRTLNPTAEHVEQAVTDRTKAVLVLHYGGSPGDITRIAELCRRRDIALIEDAACSVASTVDGRPVGAFGDFAMWSFDAMKVMVCGDGGMLYARDAGAAARARRLAYHGLTQPTGFGYAQVSPRWWELDVPEVGRRAIGNDLTAAIGAVPPRRLPELVARRREITELYDRELAGLADLGDLLTPPPLPEGHASTYYFSWVQMPPGIRDEVANELRAAGICTTFRYAPLHKVPACGAGELSLPGADHAADRTLCPPLRPWLDDADVHTVAAALRKSVEALLHR